MSKTENKNESLIRLSQSIGLLVILISMFLGALYMFDGNLIMAVPVSVVLVICMYYIVWHMVSAKMEKKRTGFSLGNKALWILYFLITIPVSFIVMHSFNVEFMEKDTIKEQGMEKTRSLKNLKNQYEKSWMAYLELKGARMNSELELYAFGKIPADTLKERIQVNDVFLSTLNKDSIAASVETFIEVEKLKFERADLSLFGKTNDYIDKKQNSIQNWHRFKINAVLTDLDEKIKMSDAKLGEFLTANADGAALLFNVEEHTQPTMIASPKELLMNNINLYFFVLLILLHGLLLLPYLIAPARVYRKLDKGRSMDNVGVTKR